MEQVPVCALITERYSVSRRFMAGGGVEGNVNRHHCMIRVAKRADVHSATKSGMEMKQIEKGSVTIWVTGEAWKSQPFA